MKESCFKSLVLKFSVLFFCLYYIFKLEGLCDACLKSLRRFYDDESVAEITRVVLKRSKLFMLTKIQGNFTI